MTFVLISFFMGMAGGAAGKVKGGSFFLWFLVSCIPPWLGVAAALLSRDEHQERYRRCPTCTKVVSWHDALCTRCGTELEFPPAIAHPAEPVAR